MYRPVFTRQPESWREWWLGIRAFTAAWYDIPPGDVVGDDPEIRALERENGVTISPSVHEWAAFTADLRKAGILEGALRDDVTLGWVPGHNALRLLTLGEGNLEWVVRREHVADEDPPVECIVIDEDHEDDDDGALETWRHTATTSEFALQQVIAYLQHPGGGFSADITPSPQLLDELRSIGQTSIELSRQTLIEGEDLLILIGKDPFTQPDDSCTIRVEIGPSRVNSVPETLSNLAHGRGVWFTGRFAEHLVDRG